MGNRNRLHGHPNVLHPITIRLITKFQAGPLNGPYGRSLKKQQPSTKKSINVYFKTPIDFINPQAPHFSLLDYGSKGSIKYSA
jgi:hypothetical protein